MKKLIPIALCATIALGAMTGCSDGDAGQASTPDNSLPAETQQQKELDAWDKAYIHSAGVWKAGYDMPPGPCILTASESGTAEITVYADESMEEAVFSDSFTGEYRITLESGQILKVSNATFICEWGS